MDPEQEADRLAALQTEIEWARLNWPDRLPEMIRVAQASLNASRELLLAKPKRTR